MTGIEYMNNVCPTTKNGKDPNREDVADAFEDGIAEGFSQCKKQFIEKACEFIRKGGNRSDAYIVTEFGEEVFDFVQLAEDFKNYMKE